MRDCRSVAVEKHRLFAVTWAGKGEGEWKDQNQDCGPVLLGGGEPVGWGHGERRYAWKEGWGPGRGLQLVETAVQGLAHTAPVYTGQEIFFHTAAGREKSFHIGAVSAVVAALGAVAESKVGGVFGGVIGGGAGNRVGGLVAWVAELGAASVVRAALAAGIASEVEVAFVVGRWLLQTGAAIPAVPVR